MERDAKIYVAGHRGLVGSALVRCLQKAGYTNLLLRTHTELELTGWDAVADFLLPKSRITSSLQRRR